MDSQSRTRRLAIVLMGVGLGVVVQLLGPAPGAHGVATQRGTQPDAVGRAVQLAAATSCRKEIKLWVVSVGTGSVSGHSFLMMKNIGLVKRHFHHNVLRPGRRITLGTWGNKDEGKGIYFNLEAHFFHQDDAYRDNVALVKRLCLGDFQWLRDRMPYFNEWSNTTNCSTFAMRMWNTVAPGRSIDADDGAFDGADTPSRLAASMYDYNYVTDVSLPDVDERKVSRLEADGDLEPASSSSMSSSSSSQ